MAPSSDMWDEHKELSINELLTQSQWSESQKDGKQTSYDYFFSVYLSLKGLACLTSFVYQFLSTEISGKPQAYLPLPNQRNFSDGRRVPVAWIVQSWLNSDLHAETDS